MTITHHPEIATLMTCAAGSQPESLSAVVAAHLSICPHCFRKVSQMSVIGEALFVHLRPVTIESAMPGCEALATTVARGNPRSWSAAMHNADVPGPLRCILGTSLDALPWQSRASGISFVQVAMSPDARGDLALVKIAPGLTFSFNGGAAGKLVMSLRGSFLKHDNAFLVGDFEDAQEDVDHTLTASGDHDCILLIASAAEPVLTKKSV